MINTKIDKVYRAIDDTMKKIYCEFEELNQSDNITKTFRTVQKSLSSHFASEQIFKI